MPSPTIIQGGMGAAVSSWRLAAAVAREGQMGVVSGTALDTVLARRLQDGDAGGYARRALAAFPSQRIARVILDAYFRPEGRAADEPYRRVPRLRVPIPQQLLELVVAANFVEVFLAREGHQGLVGINYLEKIQIPNLASIYGAMLAGVDYVIMGAGIPREIPGVLDALARHEPVSVGLHMDDAVPGEDWRIRFDPREILAEPPGVRRPRFLAIVSSNTLALTLARKATPAVDGFIVEGPTAGGHNAPPRGALTLDAAGQPIYGPRDAVDVARIAELALPFWLAGGWGRPGRLREALGLGATGIQVGTAFALCRESGLADPLRRALLAEALAGRACVFTDAVASPTGFPFKVARLAGTLSEPAEYEARKRLCDLGFLRRPYRRGDGTLGYRCPSEPVAAYVAKGGREEDTVGRKCLCNGLMANVGLPQRRPDGRVELPLVTAGDDLEGIGRFVPAGCDDYSAADVIRVLLG